MTAGAGLLIAESANHLGRPSARPPAGVVVPDVAADGITDDREAIQRALDAAPGDRRWTVWLPGLCYVGSGGNSSGAPFGLVIRRNQVTLTGATGAGLVSREPGTRLLLVSGVAAPSDDPLNDAGWITSSPVLPFAAPVAQGSTDLALQNASDAATLRPGDLVFLRTGQLTGSSKGREPDAELNQIRQISGNRIILQYPTAKPYRPERKSPNASVSQLHGDGSPTPWGLSRATGRIVRDVAVQGIRLISTSPSGTATTLRIQQAWGVTISDCFVGFGKWGIASRYSRAVSISGCKLYTFGSNDGDPAWIGPSTGCTDWRVQSCQGSGVAPARIHAHEGIADLQVLDWSSRTPEGPGKPGAENVSVRGRAYRHVYELDIAGAYTQKDCAMVRVTDQIVGPKQQVEFRRLRLRGSPGGAFIDVETPAVTIYRSGLDLPPNARIKLVNGARPFVS